MIVTREFLSVIMNLMLAVNQKVPLSITVLDQSGNTVSLEQFLGKPIVLYFYPKDDTPGCTKEACEFRDFSGEYEQLGIQVIGVSADSVDSHNSFSKKHSLPFSLWSDPEKKLLEAFGVLGEKSMFGKKFIGIRRMTFVIDQTGNLVKVWEKVKPAGHAKEVLSFVKANVL